jgi:hypothetical protein
MANKKSTSKTTKEQQRLLSIGVDIGKDVFHIVGFDLDGKIVLHRKLKRLGLEAEFAKLPRCIVGMEACLSAHFAVADCAHSVSSLESSRRST